VEEKIKISVGSKENLKTLGGWNNVIEIDDGTGFKPLRVSDHEIVSVQNETRYWIERRQNS
jgi:hypothetical protein